MLVAEVVVVGVFIAALLAAAACFGYLVYATVLEEHLLRSRPRDAWAVAEPDLWHPARGHAAFPVGRH